jgi:hypothetical protein
MMVNAQADALGLTNLLSTGVQANKAGKPEISTGHHHQVYGLGGRSRIFRAAGRIIKPRVYGVNP